MGPSYSIKLMDEGLFFLSSTVILWSYYTRPVHVVIFSVAQSFQDSVYVWEEGLPGILTCPHTPAASTVTGHHTSNIELQLC